MRYVGVAILMTLTVAVVMLPAPDPPSPGDAPSTVVSPVAICPLIEAGERSTSLSVNSSVVAAGRLSGFAAGSIVGEVDFTTGPAGSITIPASEVGAVGSGGGLVELPSENSMAGVVIESESSLAAEGCPEIFTSTAFVSGGSTAGGAGFELQLLNPFAGDAIVDLSVVTDAGLESDDRFDSVRVPASSTTTLDFGEIVPGRAFIIVDLVTSQGAVSVVARQTIGEQIATWNAIEPGQNWWLPVPAGGETKELVLASPVNAAIEFQVDFYGPDEFVEEFATGSLEPRGVARIPLTSETTEAGGVRVSSTGPLVPTLWIDSPSEGLAVTTASSVDATTWLLPGAGGPTGGSGTIIVLNTGLEEVSVSIRALGERPLFRELDLGAEGILAVGLVAADGYRVESTGPVVALWAASRSGGGSTAIGSPLQDG